MDQNHHTGKILVPPTGSAKLHPSIVYTSQFLESFLARALTMNTTGSSSRSLVPASPARGRILRPLVLRRCTLLVELLGYPNLQILSAQAQWT
jgi:hypothetical protein